MKLFILFAIRVYWFAFPEHKRKKCIFKKTCSIYVFEIAKEEGFVSGVKAFMFRYQNCRYGYEIFKDPIHKTSKLILPSKIIIEEDEIALRLIKSQN